MELLTRAQFAEEIFYRYGYDLRGTIVGFNLPFDLSRIAIGMALPVDGCAEVFHSNSSSISGARASR